MRPKHIKTLITKALEDHWSSDQYIQPIHLWGPPGVGKSALPREIAEEKNIGFVDLRMTLLDPTDLRGIPTVVGEQAKWLPPTFLPTEKFCMDCYRPILPKDGKCPRCGKEDFTEQGILFLDEMTSAPPLTQASAYQLTLDRAIGEYNLPDGWYILAAGNRMEDRAVVHRTSTALLNRFTHVDFEVNLDDWVEWAIYAKINPTIIGFIKFRTNLLFDFKPESSERAFPTPRSWDFASRILRFCPQGILAETLEGTVGKGATAEFMQFLKIQTKLPDINAILEGKNKDYVPKELSLKYALVSALAGRAEGVKHFENLLKYSYNLEAEFGVFLITMLAGKDDKTIASAPSFDKWARDHSEIIILKR